MAWKAIQEMLRTEGISEAGTGSPRDILKLAYAHGYLVDQEQWLLMLKKRNANTHIYDEEEIDELLVMIKDSFIPALGKLEVVLKSNDEIYLATEDEDILQRMKELCGDRLRYIDQKRFRINPGELLSDQKKERENEGWLKGKEYLTTLKFLSECKAFIASGGCCGTTCVLNSDKDNFDKSYVFDLGCY